MDYQKQYNNLIKKRKNNILKDCYYEIHHILPKSLGGKENKENLVKLTAREHWIAHKLLSKIYGGKMNYALWRMCNSKKYDKIITSREYKGIRERHSLFLKNNNPMKGKSLYNTWVEKYGIEEGHKRWEDWKIKEINSAKKGKEHHHYKKTNMERWIEKYGIEEAEKQYKKWYNSFIKNTPRGKKCHTYKTSMKDILIKKYGIEEGHKRWEEKKKKNGIASKGKLSGNWSGYWIINGEKFITIKEVCEKFDISPSTVCNLCKKGIIISKPMAKKLRLKKEYIGKNSLNCEIGFQHD